MPLVDEIVLLLYNEMSNKITDEEFDKFVANTDKILDMMVLKAEKE